MRLKILSIGPRWQLAKLKAPCLEPVIGIWNTRYCRRCRVVYVLFKGEYRESQGIIPAKGRSTRPIWPAGISLEVVGNLQFNDTLPHPELTIPPLIEIPVPPKGCSFAWARAVKGGSAVVAAVVFCDGDGVDDSHLAAAAIFAFK